MNTNIILKWKNMPILLSSTNDNKANDIFYTFELKVDKDTGAVHQTNIPPQDILYKNSRNSGIGNVWNKHYDCFCKFIFNNINLTDKKICEIGSGNGYVANKIGEKYKIDCYEPTPTFESTNNINLIKKFMEFDDKQQYDVIILSHTFEHITDPADFLCKIHKSLKKEGIVIMSYPNFEIGLNNNHVNLFNSEHISYFTTQTTEKFFNKYFFQNCIIEEYDDHSLFVLAQKSDINTFVKLTDVELNTIVHNTNEYISTLQNKINIAVSTISNFDDIYIFGCHAMTSIFLYLSNITTNKFKGILDNDPLKYNLRLYGTDLICYNPDTVLPTNVLLNGGVYHNEIKYKLVEQGFNVIEWI
jgi:2-polyprenyl-3-methyl-5-hydroxy-6-metoxy-1,4-benzoquinol methylase